MKPRFNLSTAFNKRNASRNRKTLKKTKHNFNLTNIVRSLFPTGIPSRIFILSVILTLLGLLFIADVSAPEAISVFNDKFYYAKQQLMWGVLGILVMFVVSNIKVSYWEKWSTHIFFVSLILLVLVLIPGFSVRVLGAKRWLKLGPVGLQPSEFFKLGMVLYFAKLAKHQKKLISYIVPMGMVTFLIMMQPDLGTTLVIGFIALSQILVSEVPIMSMVPLVLVSIIVGTFFVFSSEYRRLRFTSFIDPFSDVQGSSYHIQQILFALASGGFFGVGLGQSKQKYLFLPEASTDSIFAIIGEEIGFLGSVAIILIFVILLVNLFGVVKRSGDIYSRVLSIGITSWLAGQTLINLGAIVSAIPFTGVPLPFLSYGGSSLLTLLIAMGIIISIAKNQ